MSIIRELKQRKVFRVAAVYAVLAWGILQVVDAISEPLSLPLWFSTVTILLLAIGFPVALIFSWIFDFGPEGPTRTVTDASATTGARGGFEVALLVVLIIGIGWLIFRDISDVLADLPVITQKEAIGSTWDREVQILKQKPSLVLIHRSAFFHSMNQELGIGYPAGAEDYSDEFRRLYQIADNKLVALLGFLANGSHGTKFLVYSRGTGGGWSDPEYRTQWIHQAEGRFPDLADKITAIIVPGGTEEGSFRRPDTAELIRRNVQKILLLKVETGD